MRIITVSGYVTIKEYKTFEIEVDDSFNSDDIEYLTEQAEEQAYNEFARGGFDGDNLELDVDMVR